MADSRDDRAGGCWHGRQPDPEPWPTGAQGFNRCVGCGTPLPFGGPCYLCQQDAYLEFEDEDTGDDHDGPTCPHCGYDAPGHFCDWCQLDF